MGLVSKLCETVQYCKETAPVRKPTFTDAVHHWVGPVLNDSRLK
jgi:hypothetical protein